MTQAVVQVRNIVARSGFANPLTLEVLVTDEDYLKVYADTTLLDNGPDYEITGIGDPNGVSIEIIGAEDVDNYVGTINFVAVYEPPLDQQASLSAGGVLGRSFESGLDQQNRRLQALGDQVKRSLKVNVNIDGDIVLDPVDGQIPVWNEDTQQFDFEESVPSTQAVAAAAEAAASAAAAAASALDAETEADAAAASAIAAAASAAAAAIAETAAELAETNAEAAEVAAEAAQAAAEAAVADALPKAGGTMTGPIGFTHQASPADPAAGVLALFAKNDNKMYTRTSGGVETEIGGSGLPTAGGTMTGPIAFSGEAAALDDPSAVPADPTTFWTEYFANPANGIVHRLNRLLVGVAAETSSDNPPSVMDWLETLIGTTTRNAQLSAISAIGGLALLGAARTSDFEAWAGSPSGGSQGVTGFGWNDDLTPATTPIAVGAEFRGFRKATANGITLGAQISAANEGSTVDSTPWAAIASGTTIALLLTNGPGPTNYDNPIAAGLVFGTDTSYMRKGVVAAHDVFDPSLGAGGAGVFADLARGHSVRWLNSGATVDAEFWGDASGFAIAAAARIGANLANYVTITGSATTQPIISVDGSSADVDLYMRPKGLGTVIAQKLDAATSSVSIAHQIRHSLSSGTAAAGIGVGQNFVIVNASAVNKIIAAQEAVTTDATNATEDADFVWKLMAAGAAAAEKLRLSSVGKLTAQGGVVSVDPLNGNGYATGAGGAVTQVTSKATGVTLNKVCGQITTHNASLAANTTVIFTVTDSAVAATDVVRVTIGSGGTAGAYLVWVSATAAGSFNIAIRNITAGALGEALVLNFAVTKAVAA